MSKTSQRESLLSSQAEEEVDFVEETYVQFKTSNKEFWTYFLIAIIVLSVILTWFTLYTINLDNSMDCGGLLYCLYGMVMFHMVNMIVAFIALIQMELKVCTNNACLCYVLYVLVNIIGIQVGFFGAQSNRCFQNGTAVYNATFVQILVLYFFLIFVVCHLFRKNCQVVEVEEIPEEIKKLQVDFAAVADKSRPEEAAETVK